MRLLHVIDSGGMYGAEVMLLNLVEEQIRHNLSPLIASIGDQEHTEKNLEIEALKRNIPIKAFRMRPGPNFLGVLQIISYAKSQNCTLFHSHGYKSNILLGLLPRRVRKFPLVSTIHGWTATSGLSKMKIYEYADRFSLRFADAVVLVNQEMLHHPYFKKSRLSHIQVIENGITENPVHRSVYREDIHKFCKGYKVIGAIGRLSDEKGFRYLIEAFGKISKSINNVRLLILGEGPQRGLLQELETQLLEPDLVYMPGFVDEANRYLNLFDVLAIPSLSEGLPITLLEALRSGVPVVASAVGGIPSVLENGKFGRLVPPCNTKELVSALSQALDQDRHSIPLGQYGREHFLKNYTSYKMCKNYLRLYNDVLSGISSPGHL